MRKYHITVELWREIHLNFGLQHTQCLLECNQLAGNDARWARHIHAVILLRHSHHCATSFFQLSQQHPYLITHITETIARQSLAVTGNLNHNSHYYVVITKTATELDEEQLMHMFLPFLTIFDPAVIFSPQFAHNISNSIQTIINE